MHTSANLHLMSLESPAVHLVPDLLQHVNEEVVVGNRPRIVHPPEILEQGGPEEGAFPEVIAVRTARHGSDAVVDVRGTWVAGGTGTPFARTVHLVRTDDTWRVVWDGKALAAG